MKTVQSIETIKVKVSKDELLNDKFISFQLLSKKLGEIEQQNKMGYKYLRNRFYNSRACNKYNMETIAGILYIDTINPMKGTASLTLTFEVA